MQRKLTVHATSGYRYKDTPTIQLKGTYLEQFGFQIGKKLSISIEDNKILIFPQEKQQ